jgi:EpsD family peptidyl-prolyl cis-trans isomerase
MSLRTATYAALVAALLTTTACGKKATGQVVAVVNGDEITLDELNAELSGVNLPPNADKKLAMRQLLQQVVDRRLLAQSAKEQGLDKDPSYITQQRRMNEDLLVRMFAKKSADTIPVPTAVEIDKYIASHPMAFGSRTRYKLDQIRFELPADPTKLLKALEADHSMDAIISRLTSMSIKYERGNSALDSGAVAPAALKQVTSLPPGEPFITPTGRVVAVSVITGSEPLTVPEAQVRPLAVQAIRNETLSKIGEKRLKEARASGKIEYQPGYEAPEAKPAAGK